jgi:putative peptide zinc metalloprotease protein
MNDPIALVVNPLLEVSDFDSDATRPMKLCALPRANGEGDVRFAVPAEYLDFTREFDGQRDIDEVIGAYIERCGSAQGIEWWRELVNRSLLPRGILITRDQDPQRAANSSQSSRAFLHIKLPIIKASVVAPVARRLSFLFRVPVMCFGLAAFIAMHVYVYGFLFSKAHFDFNQLDITSVVLLMVISTVGTLCHEFGHASAASHFGCRDMTIGWGVYLIYTVLWTNVSDAWKLPRRQRAIIDVGGVYFESFFLIGLVVAYLVTRQPIFLFGFVFVDLSIANTFNPFLRMDGYWLVSDLFGIVNLRRQQEAWWQDIAGRLFRPGSHVSHSTLSRRARWVLGLYTVVGTLFIAFVLKTMFQVVVLNILSNLPEFLAEHARTLSSAPTLGNIVHALLESAWRVLVIVGAALTFWNIGRALLRAIARFRIAVQLPGSAT